MMGNDFPWFYNKAITQENNNKRFQFVHTFIMTAHGHQTIIKY